MATIQENVAETRAVLIRGYREALKTQIEEATQKVGDPGPDALPEDLLTDVEREDAAANDAAAWQGVPVVSRRDLDEFVEAIFAAPMPAPDETWAEVLTPATVIVWAVCPRCAISQPISMTVHPELLIDEHGAELRIKAKAKARTHICGQLPLPVGSSEDVQEELELEDEEEPATEGAEVPDFELEPAEDIPVGPEALDLGACPWPGCELAAEHQGTHQTAVDDRPESSARVLPS